MAQTIIHFRKTEDKYFCVNGWTGQISLRSLAKSVFWRTHFDALLTATKAVTD
jgi:hypothetical protein